MGTCLLSNSFAGNNPTQYVLKGAAAPFAGFVVEQDRLQICVTAVQDANYYRDMATLQEKFYTQKMTDDAKIAALQLEITVKEDAAVEKGLKEELKSKSVWYRQWYVTVPATVISIILLKTPLGL